MVSLHAVLMYQASGTITITELEAEDWNNRVSLFGWHISNDNALSPFLVPL